MGRDLRQDLAWPANRRQDLSLCPTHEIEEAIGQYPAGLDGGGKARGHGAEIFAHYQAAVALAFKGDNGQHFLEGVVYIRAVLRCAIAWNPEQPLETQNVVDAQGAGVAHVLS